MDVIVPSWVVDGESMMGGCLFWGMVGSFGMVLMESRTVRERIVGRTRWHIPGLDDDGWHILDGGSFEVFLRPGCSCGHCGQELMVMKGEGICKELRVLLEAASMGYAGSSCLIFSSVLGLS